MHIMHCCGTHQQLMSGTLLLCLGTQFPDAVAKCKRIYYKQYHESRAAKSEKLSAQRAAKKVANGETPRGRKRPPVPEYHESWTEKYWCVFLYFGPPGKNVPCLRISDAPEYASPTDAPEVGQSRKAVKERGAARKKSRGLAETVGETPSCFPSCFPCTSFPRL